MSDDRESKNKVFRGNPKGEPVAPPGIQTMSVAERMKKEFGIDVIPAELVRLPSGGKIYPAESGLLNRVDVEINAMTTRHQDILGSRAYAKKGTTITELIKACLSDKSIDVEQLIAGDRNALMVAVRITGFGPKLKPELKCPGCGQLNHPTFDLTQVSLKPLEAEPVAPGVNEFAFELPQTKAKCTYKLLTVKDETDLVEQLDRKKKMLNSPVDTVVTDQLKMSILSVNGKRDRAALAFFVDNMPGPDAEALKAEMVRVRPDVNLLQNFECEFCDFAEEVEIPIDREFFWPRPARQGS